MPSYKSKMAYSLKMRVPREKKRLSKPLVNPEHTQDLLDAMNTCRVACQRYNAKWVEGGPAPALYHAAVGNNAERGVQLQDHVLKLLGYDKQWSASPLPLSQAEQAWVDYMIS